MYVCFTFGFLNLFFTPFSTLLQNERALPLRFFLFITDVHLLHLWGFFCLTLSSQPTFMSVHIQLPDCLLREMRQMEKKIYSHYLLALFYNAEIHCSGSIFCLSESFSMTAFVVSYLNYSFHMNICHNGFLGSTAILTNLIALQLFYHSYSTVFSHEILTNS